MPTAFPRRVRLANPEDEQRIVTLLDALEADNGFSVPKDPDKILAQILGTHEVTERDWHAVTTIVQWLATNVGESVLRDAGYVYKEPIV